MALLPYFTLRVPTGDWVPPEGWAAYMREYRRRHKAAGLCRYCSHRAMSGGTRCAYHYVYHQERREQYLVRQRKLHGSQMKLLGKLPDVEET